MNPQGKTGLLLKLQRHRPSMKYRITPKEGKISLFFYRTLLKDVETRIMLVITASWIAIIGAIWTVGYFSNTLDDIIDLINVEDTNLEKETIDYM